MAVSNQTLKLLAQYVGGMNAQSVQTDMARQILLRSQIDWSVPNYKPKGGKSGPSVVSRIFDVLSRPNYMVANIHKPQLQAIAKHDLGELLRVSMPNETIKRSWAGLSGKEKTTFTQTLLHDETLNDTALGNFSNPVRAGLGLALDIGTDPTTYVGPGLVKGVGKALNIGQKGAKTAAEAANVPKLIGSATDAPQVLKAADILKSIGKTTDALPVGKVGTPASRNLLKSIKWSDQAIEGATETSKRLIGESKHLKADTKLRYAAGKKYGAEFSNQMRHAQSVAKVTRSPGYYGQVQRAEQLLNRIAQSDPQAISRVKPKPPVEKIPVTKAEKSLAITIARQTTRKLPTGTQKVFNPKQQLVVFNSLLRKTTGSPLERMNRATAMLRASEKYLQSQGYTFKLWDGTAVKLTEVFDEIGDMSKIGPDILTQLEKGRINNPMLDQAVEALRVRSAMADSKTVVLGLDQVTEAAAKAEGGMSPARSAMLVDGLSEDLKQGLRAARVSEAGQNTAKALFKNIVASRSAPVQQVLNGQADIARDIMRGKATREMAMSRQQVVNRAIERHMGSPYRNVATKLGDRNKAIEYLGERFAAHYGASLLHPMQQSYMLSAMSNASARTRALNAIAKSTTPAQRVEALKAAQRMSVPGMLPPADPAVDAVGMAFRTEIEKLFSSTGIKDAASSVATRAAFTMDDINRELRIVGSKFQFTNSAKVIDEVTNEARDFSQGVDWLKSWETYKLADKEDPLELISKLQIASEKVSRRYALLDEVGARFGSPVRSGAHQYRAADPRMAGRYFSKEVVAQINRMNDTLKNVYNPTNGFIKFVDKVTSAWKSGVTIYAPSHHIRNFIGDTWMSWIAGVNNPKVYTTAGNILKTYRGHYAGALVEDLVHPGALNKAMSKPGKIAVRNKSGQAFTHEQIYIAAHQRGLLLKAKQLEDIYGERLMPNIFGGHVHKFASSASEVRDHTVRLAHFIDDISKSKGSDLKSILDNAAFTVRKWHPDGMDLTNFERKYMRRIFPFYSWTRKAFPLVLEAMVMKPGKVVAYPKTMEALQGALGIEGVTRSDPFPDDGMFPEWMKEKGVGPLGKTGMDGLPGIIAGLSRQGADEQGNPVGGYTMLNPSNPMADLVASFGGSGNPRAPLQGVASMLNPMAKIPIEVTTDKQMFTDVPVSYDPNRYATEQIPGGAIASRLTNMGIFGPTERGRKEGFGNQEALINYLTAAGLIGSGPYAKSVEYQQKMKSRDQNKKAIEELLRRSAGR